MRRLLALVSAIVLLDTMFYAAIAPLLPYYAQQLDLSKASAGVLVAAYPAGTLLASLPAGWLAVEIGSRRTVLVGLALLAVASVGFGFLHDIVALDIARFVQGVGGAASWTGGLTWLVSLAPQRRRAEMIGSAFGAAVGGALFGPVLGGVANALGPEPVFGAVAVVAVVLSVLVVREPLAPAKPERSRGQLRRAVRQRRLLAGAWLIALVGVFFGVLDVLLPLRLARGGAGAGVIAATFLVSAGLSAATSPLMGRIADRRGREAPAAGGLLACAAVAVLVPLAVAPAALVALGVAAGPLVGMLWVPGMALLSDGADEARIDQAFGFAIMNLAWAGAAALGSSGGGALAKVTSDALPFALIAALSGLSFVALARRGFGAGDRVPVTAGPSSARRVRDY